MRSRVLVVDDESSIRRVLQAQLIAQGHDVDTACDGTEAVAKLHDEPYDVVITDMKMPGMGGLELLAYAKESWPGLPVIMITAHGTVDSAVEAIKLGAHDYITKPFDIEELRQAMDKAVRTERVRRKSVMDDPGVGRFDIIGRTTSMQRVYGLVEKVADSPTTVLIVGESGTGKELVARALHAASSRKDQAFITVNCGAIPENLFESELFGYEKGAFTGAATTKPGKFDLADKGTLFLDEIGDLPREMQVKLLRALQERQVDRVGGTRSVPVDVRVIAATNADLAGAVARGEFREDLYYRLNVVPIRLPPLRERKEDIPLLVAHFVARFNERLKKGVRAVSPAALTCLAAHPWPGNIRELENRIERAVLLVEGDVIDVVDLPDLDAPSLPLVAPDAVPEVGAVGLKDFVRVHTARLERALILKTLEQEGGNVTRAARRLDISRKSLQLKMKEYGLREAADED